MLLFLLSVTRSDLLFRTSTNWLDSYDSISSVYCYLWKRDKQIDTLFLIAIIPWIVSHFVYTMWEKVFTLQRNLSISYYLLQSALFSSTTCYGKEDKSSVVPSTAALIYEMGLWASRTSNCPSNLCFIPSSL